MRQRSRKPRGPAKVNYTLLQRADHPSEYKLVDQLVKAHHTDLRDARIALAWCTSWRRDVDGRIKLGQCRRASALDRQLHEFDFVILLQKEFWTNVTVSNEQRTALVDHELCHASVKLDPHNGEPIEDENGRKVYRTRKHDIEEFGEIVERHGLYKRDLEQFAQAILRAQHAEQSRLPMDAKPALGQSTQTH